MHHKIGFFLKLISLFHANSYICKEEINVQKNLQ